MTSKEYFLKKLGDYIPGTVAAVIVVAALIVAHIKPTWGYLAVFVAIWLAVDVLMAGLYTWIHSRRTS